jgi:hypothetical protein
MCCCFNLVNFSQYDDAPQKRQDYCNEEMRDSSALLRRGTECTATMTQLSANFSVC